MPIIAALPAALAIGIAASSVAAVGLTVASGFAIAAAVGATLAAVGHYTGIKELKIAGTILGIVGGVGGLAAGAGMFASAAAEGASSAVTPLAATTAAPTAAAGEAAAAATSAATQATAPAGEATAALAGNLDIAAGAPLYSSNAGLMTEMSAAGLPLEGTLVESADIISTLNGVTTADFQTAAPATQNLATAPSQQFDYYEPGTMTPEDGTFQNIGLVDRQTPMAEYAPRTDTLGRPMEFGGGENQQLGSVKGYETPELNVAEKMDPAKAAVPDQAPPPEPVNPEAVRAAKSVEQNALKPNASMDANVPGSWDAAQRATAGKPPTLGGPVLAEEPGIFDKILTFAEKNSNLTIGALLSASSFLSGALKGGGSSAEEAAYYAAAAERNLAAADLDRLKATNSQGPFPKMRNPIRPLTDEEVVRPIRRQTPKTPVAVTGKVNDINEAVTGRVTL